MPHSYYLVAEVISALKLRTIRNPEKNSKEEHHAYSIDKKSLVITPCKDEQHIIQSQKSQIPSKRDVKIRRNAEDNKAYYLKKYQGH